MSRKSLLLPALVVGALMQPYRLPAQLFTNLYSFTGRGDGAVPYARLILSGDTLYGTASSGCSGSGAVFKINTNGTAITSLHCFTGGDGFQPIAGLTLSGNTLYGTVQYGGSLGYGAVFAVNTDGTAFTNLHNFTGSDGYYPVAGLILLGSTLYGAAVFGGSSSYGTVFALRTNGTGFTVVHNFDGLSDGVFPAAPLILSGTTLFGTTLYGDSAGGNGTLFKVNTDGTGFTNLHSFTSVSGAWPNYTNSDGASPRGALILLGETLYGTASEGGSSGFGTLFRVNTNGTRFTILHSFSAGYTNSDGADPGAGMILSGHTLLGTTVQGGSSGNGTIFRVNTDGTGFTILHNFSAVSGGWPTYNSDGAKPWGGLTLSGNTMYGTTLYGGSSGFGTVFGLSILPGAAIRCPEPLVLECTIGGAPATLAVNVTDSSTNPVVVIWTVDGTPYQTNTLPSGWVPSTNVTLTADFALGVHLVTVSAFNGETAPATCSTTVQVRDTIPPRIVSVSATPDLLWPPDHRSVPVTVEVQATDNCGPTMSKIVRVTSNESSGRNKRGADWLITGDLSVDLRAERHGEDPGRIYTIFVECLDIAGNSSSGSVIVRVPHDQVTGQQR